MNNTQIINAQGKRRRFVPLTNQFQVICAFALLFCSLGLLKLAFFHRPLIERIDVQMAWLGSDELWTTHGNEPHFSAMEYREGLRAQERLKARGISVPDASIIARATSGHYATISRPFTLELKPVDASVPSFGLTIDLRDHQDWFSLKTNWVSAEYIPVPDAIAEDLPRILSGHESIAVTMAESEYLDGKQLKLDVSRRIHDGWYPDIEEASRMIARALSEGMLHASVPVEHRAAEIVLEDGTRLKLLASGISDFKGSPANRIHNIHKGFDDHINNVLVPAGDTFSFVNALNGPVTLSRGWKMALGIFGSELEMTPGGGICQTSTTLFRAIYNAGLPILEQANHSWYIHYYEKYGVGIDATIFPGAHDLVFQNDTGEDIFIQAFAEGDTATVNIYGVDDGREVVLNGPYFSSTPNLPEEIGALKRNHVGWVRTVTKPDGTVAKEALVSKYRTAIPSRAIAENPTMETLHAAAAR